MRPIKILIKSLKQRFLYFGSRLCPANHFFDNLRAKQLMIRIRAYVISTLLVFAYSNLQAKPLDKIIAVVNDSVVTQSELGQQLDLIKIQFEASNTSIPDETVLTQQVLDQMINQELQLQLATQANLTVSDDEVNQIVNNIAQDNDVSTERLKKEIEMQGISFPEYFDKMKNDLIISRVQQEAVGRNIRISDQQVDNYLQSHQEEILANQEYHLRNILIPLSESPTPDQIVAAETTGEEIMNQLNEGADFSTLAITRSGDQLALQGGDLGWRRLAALPEIFADNATHMDIDDIVGPIRAGNGFHIIKLEGVRSGLRSTITLTHVRQILLRVEPGSPAGALKKKLSNIREEIIQGDSFSKQAELNSQDINSAKRGGDMGWVKPGELVPAFEDEMDQLQPGEVSQPIRTPYGLHLIEVIDRKEEDDSENQLRQQTRMLLFQRNMDEALQKWMQQLKEQAYVDIIDRP